MSSATVIRSGTLRHRIQFLKDMGTVDDGGSVPPDFQPTGNVVQCSVTPLSGGKQYFAQQEQSRVTHSIVMRYRPGIDPHWRIQWGTRVFTIERVIDVEERHRKIEISAAEVT